MKLTPAELARAIEISNLPELTQEEMEIRMLWAALAGLVLSAVVVGGMLFITWLISRS